MKLYTKTRNGLFLLAKIVMEGLKFAAAILNMKSKKWRRRRPVIVHMSSSGGWHCKLKFRWHQWEIIEAAMNMTGENLQQYFERILREELNGV